MAIAIGSESIGEALDIKRRDLILFETRRIRFASGKVVHAQDPRSPAAVGTRTGSTPDRRQLLGGPIHRSQIPEAGRNRPNHLASSRNLNDQKLDELLFGGRPAPPSRRIHSAPDFAAIGRELQINKNVTLELLWQEYRAAQPDGYGYSRFCDLYRQWRRNQDLTLRQQHTPGEKMFVDYAGATIPIHDRQTGEVHPAAIFVATLGFSNYTFAEATWNQQSDCWIGSHIRAFEYFGGLPQLVVPDNTKTGVSKACRYEPDLNPTYNDLAAHYGVAVMPARPRKPRDKAKVENAVQLVQRWIVASLRKRTFYSLGKVNEAIGELLTRLNDRPFRKRPGTRASLFTAFDQPALRQLDRANESGWPRD
jgi:transposase